MTAGQRVATDLLTLAAVAAWYLLSLRLPEYVLPEPAPVLARTVQLLIEPRLAAHTYASLGRVVLAVLLSVGVGIVLALTAYAIPLVRGAVTRRLIPFLNAFPTLGWAILAVYWFGISDAGVVFVEVVVALPFTMINLWEGLKALDEPLLEMALSFGRDRLRLLRLTVMPMLLPYLLASARLSYGVIWKISLVAEIFGTQRGLGFLINIARVNFDSTLAVAAILTVILLVFVVDQVLFGFLDRRLRRHRLSPSGEAELRPIWT